MLNEKQISPLLDDYIIGDPISDHHGIRCCPAINRENDKRYIVKIISVPASQTQLDALLLTGAVDSTEAAKEYFRERVNDHIQEIEILQNLSRHEGFLPYSGHQVCSKEDDTGFELYILSEYKRSLERQFTKKPFTQLDAINLGMDICSALTACRRNGYMFVNLKPSNIYVAESGEYKLSDFGFIKLNNLKYATIPEHYLGKYTAPEIVDAFSPLNDKLDVYALGMILYEIYNGGAMPENDRSSLIAPAYADAELSQIILKACSSDHEERWNDPAQMGQMLVSYMQKNGVSDTPIVPPLPEPAPEEITEEDDGSAAADGEISDIAFVGAVQELLDETEVLTEEAPNIQVADISPEPEQLSIEEDIIAEEQPVSEMVLTADSEESVDTPDDAEAFPGEPAPTIPADDAEITEEIIPEEASEEDIVEDSPEYEGVTDEVSEILSKADSLAAMEVPDPVVAPEAKEIVLPDTQEELTDSTESSEETDEEGEKQMEYYVDIPEEPKKSHFVRNIVLIAVLLGLLIGGFLFYKFYILQTINNITLNGNKDQLSVVIASDIDESLLSVSCTDANTLKSIHAPVVNGEATFSGLSYGSQYTIEVKINGLHILQGNDNTKITQSYWTPREIKIKDTEVLTGLVPGSAVLNFSVETGLEVSNPSLNPDTLRWKFIYSCVGSDAKTAIFDGTMLTITDLVEGKVYNGVLELENELYISETYEIVFTPSDIIKANDLTITGCTNGTLTAQWKAPEDVKVDTWQVRCYNSRDYDKTITTASTNAEFSGLNSEDGFTVEVTAMGQSLKQTATVGANSVTVSNISADTATPGVIALKWDASAEPANGWIINYDVSGCESVVRVTGDVNEAELTPAIPGATYTLSIRSADSIQTLCADFECTVPETGNSGLKIGDNIFTTDSFLYTLCERPAKLDWTYHDVVKYTQRFELSQEAAIVVFLNSKYEAVNQEITAAFVVRDSDDQLISIDSELLNWNSMWIDKNCHLNIPKLPNAVGRYTIEIYFNGVLIASRPFTVS